MVIANPIYDVVFKRLMENEKVAKFFIGTLLEETIETVEVKPQELTYDDKQSNISLFRLDFIATIKTENGEYKKILVELQKAKNEVDLMRFRGYLAEQYKKVDTINGEEIILPITTIYILGFKLPEIETPCIKVERNYRDLVNQVTLDAKSEFVEKLSHDSYVVQVRRITGRYSTKLDKLLSIFEQSNFIDDSTVTKEFKHDTDLQEIQIMTDILHHAGTNPAEKKQIELEVEAWRTYDAMFATERNKLKKDLDESRKEVKEKDKALNEKEQALNEKDQTINKKDQTINEKDQTINEKDQTINEKDQAINEKDQTIEQLKKQLDDLLKKQDGRI
jgi:hypothetical protein